MKEGIDDITPFTGIIQLAVHPITDNRGIRLRKRKDEKLFSHGAGFRQAFKLYKERIINLTPDGIKLND